MKKLIELVQARIPNEIHTNICNDIWNKVSANIQRNKLNTHGLIQHEQQIFNQLKERPKLLIEIATDMINSNTDKQRFVFCEIGTAQGLQSLIFGQCFKDSSVYTCDIVDDRSKLFDDINIHKNVEFINGNSYSLALQLKSKNEIADFIWVDGSHDENDVLKDFIHLVKFTHENTIWAFDDFDKRFGCYKDISILMKLFKEHVVVNMGITASGQPNIIVLAKGFI